MNKHQKGNNMAKLVNNHTITFTVGTAVICFLVVFKFAFSLGAEQKQIITTVTQNKQVIEKHIEEDKQQRKDDAERRRLVDEAIIKMVKDIEYIKKELKKKNRGF
jgi:ABC-type transporter MlaC component